MTSEHSGRRAPRELVDAECSRRGRAAFIAGCRRLVAGDYNDTSLIVALAPEGSAKYFDGQPHDDEYWFRVWGIRGLLWAWDDSATDAVVTGAADETWRVREMAAKVVARHLVGDALPLMVGLRNDPVPRVRAAAERAVRLLSDAGT
ncbi:MAG: HEAT repeat domain-containing protein [Frankiaceae bacterium]|nr:HEAT repeat domain-containing protein [Frankiaceae bacterium]